MSRFGDLLHDLPVSGVSYRNVREVARIAGRNVQPSAMQGPTVTIYSLPSFDQGMRPERLAPDQVGSAKTTVTRPAVLVAKLNPHIPRVWRLEHVEANSYCSPEFFPLEPLDGSIEVGYLYYFILTKMSRLSGVVTGGTNSHKRLHRDDFLDLRIPVPRVGVQREIVRILDLFQALEAELDAELEARRLQYDYYRDRLMTYAGSSVATSRIGDLATVVRGASPRPIQKFLTRDPDGVPWIKIGDVAAASKYITRTAERVTPDGAKKSRRVRPGDFVLSNSMSFGRPYISKIEGCIHDGWLAISEFSESFIPDFLYHLLRSAPVQAEFERRAGSGTVRNLNADIVKSVVVPVPSIEEQRRIAEMLDGFEVLVNDLSVGLPAELNARRKQYEYYRDQLLTFRELSA